MKKLAIWGILAALLCALPARAEGPSALCLQVIGETDLSEDQQFKLRVHAWAEELLLPPGEISIQEQALSDLQGELNRRAEASGHLANIRVCTGCFPYDAHILGNRVYPVGKYPAIRITIGGGQGRNWWGVLYEPPEPDTIYYSILVEWFLKLFQ